jgi:hypothetical protein
VSLHVVTLEQEDVVVAPAPGLPFAATIQLSIHGIIKVEEARTKYGGLAVQVALQVPSDEFYPERLPEPPE